MKVVILSGGKGTRLGLNGIPKPMVPVDGVPLLERLVVTAAQAGFTDFILLSGYLGEVIEAYFGDGSRFGVHIEHVIEQEPMGPAGAVRLIKDRLTEPFLVIYGDVLMDVDLRHFADFALAKGGLGTLFVHPNDHPHDSDLLEVDETGRIVRFFSKPHTSDQRLPNVVSAAIYVLYPEAVDYVADGVAADWGRDIFAKIIELDPLYAYRSVEYVKDIGTPGRLQKAEGHLREGRVAGLSRRTLKPAIFVDRDGVINEERDGVIKADGMKLLPGVAAAIRRVNDAGIPLICVTNQPFLAKGMLTWPALRTIHAEMDCQIAEESGGYIDDVFVCPHHPEKGWAGEVAELKIDCDCRKPKPGLLRQAAEFHAIDLTRSWLVGDRYCDVAAAHAAGARSVLVRTGHNGSDRSAYSVTPDFIADDLSAAIDHILGTLR